MTATEIEKIVKDFRDSDPELQQEAIAFTNDNGDEATPVPVQTSVKQDGTTTSYPYRHIPLSLDGRTHIPSDDTKDLMETEVTFDDLYDMTSKFYELAFEDDTLDQFIHSHQDPHGERFAKWIYQKFSGETIWDDDRHILRDLTPKELAGGRGLHVVQDRTTAHVAAWYSRKRKPEHVGRKFTVNECRVWMRLHFYAMRHVGLVDKSPTFADYYMRFIAHFMNVYNSQAPQYAQDSYDWSADTTNVETYMKNGHTMIDLVER